MGPGKSKLASSNRSSGNISFDKPYDADTLSEKQIRAINDQRYEVWQDARTYARENQKLDDPRLTKTQNDLYNKMQYDNDFSSIDKANVKTLNVLKSKAEFEYDASQRRIARGDYLVQSDFSLNMSQDKIQSGHFTDDYKSSKKAKNILSEIQNRIDKKKKK